MEFRDVRLALRRHWVAAVVTWGFFIALGLVAGVLPHKVYSASATLSVTPTNPTSVTGANTLIPIFVIQVSTDNFSGDVQKLVTDQSTHGLVPASVARETVSLSANNPNGTGGIIVITGKSPDPQASAVWASAAATQLVNQADVVNGPAQRIGVNVQVIQPATIPSKPSAPKPIPIVVGNTLLGLIAAVVIALMAEWLHRSREPGLTVRRRLGAPLLCSLPKTRELRGGDGALLGLLGRWQSGFSDKTQELRTNAEVAMAGATSRTIAVVSGVPGEGSTTVAVCLAVGLASVGYEVTAVDSDLRRGRLRARLGGPGSPGLGEVARGEPATAHPTATPGVSIVPAGQTDRHPAETLRVALPLALEQLPSDRLVIVDCPAMTVPAEAAFVLRTCHSVILVVDAHRLRSKDVERASAEIRALGGELIGVVLNRTVARRPAPNRRAPSPARGRGPVPGTARPPAPMMTDRPENGRRRPGVPQTAPMPPLQRDVDLRTGGPVTRGRKGPDIRQVGPERSNGHLEADPGGIRKQN
jgi:Mrp family chromosome partitioning ATPase/capsular polysaccharide biosynthesis protein